jgi:GT2 family glycosyltransferase
MTPLAISAVTVTYFSDLSLLRALLWSVYKAVGQLHQRTGSTFTFYIVDNSQDDDYFWSLESLLFEVKDNDFFTLHIHKPKKNLGFSGGNNFVIDRLGSDLHLVINPDVIVESDSLCMVEKYFRENENVAMISPKIVNGVGVKHSIKTYPDSFTLLLRYLGLPFLNRRFAARLGRYQCDYLIDEADGDVSLAGGCFLVLKTKVFKELKGFDDHFFMYFEDYDLSIRARSYGNIAYVPDVKIKHMGGFVGGKTPKHHVFFAVSALKFSMRHGWKLW